MNKYTINVRPDEYYDHDCYKEYKVFSGWRNMVGDINASGNFNNITEDFEYTLRKKYNLTTNDIISIPLYVYNHSGYAFSSSPFSCKWDSGQIGYIFMTKEDIRRNYGVKRISKSLTQKIVERLESDIEVIEAEYNGENFCFTVEDEEGDFVDSCSGFLRINYNNEQLTKDIFDHISKDSGITLEDVITACEAA